MHPLNPSLKLPFMQNTLVLMKRVCFPFAVLIFALCSSVQAAEPTRPHIVVILVDDMGYGDPGCFNADSKIPTPHIDRLAREGMRFTDAHAPGPLCHLSRYGLLTGRYPFRTNVGVWRKQPVIKKDRLTLPGLLRDSGYSTTMVGKWHLGFDEQNGYDERLPGGPVDRGFDHFFGIRASTDIPPYFYIRGNRAVQPPTEKIEANQSEGWSPIQGAFWRAGGIAPDLELTDVLPRFTDEAVAAIDRHAKQTVEKPMFLYLAYPAPHTPWLPAKPYLGKSQAGMYGDFTVMVDAMIGRVMKALDDAKMSGNTLLVFTSDNGPVWYDADVERFGHDSMGPWRGMKADAWEAGHRMPFIVRWPERVAAGGESRQLVCFTDLMTTFASLLDRPLPDDAAPDSFDFSSALLGRGDSTRARREFAMRSGRGLRVFRSGDWKLILGRGSGGFTRTPKPAKDEPAGQLYNLRDDPSESKNLYAQQADRVERMTARLREIETAGRHRE